MCKSSKNKNNDLKHCSRIVLTLTYSQNTAENTAYGYLLVKKKGKPHF